MQAQNAAQLRPGAVALGLSLLLVPVAFGIITTASDAQTLTSGLYLLRQVLLLSSFILLIFGSLGLYASLANSRMARLAFAGMILCVVGSSLFLPFFGIFTFAAPVIGQLSLQGHRDALNVLSTITASPGAISLAVASLLLTLGDILFAIAIWRSGTLPKWAGVIYALGSVILSFQPVLPQIGLIIGGLVTLIGGAWLALAIWRQASGSRERVSAVRVAE
jgi:hypothetical protein